MFLCRDFFFFSFLLFLLFVLLVVSKFKYCSVCILVLFHFELHRFFIGPQKAALRSQLKLPSGLNSSCSQVSTQVSGHESYKTCSSIEAVFWFIEVLDICFNIHSSNKGLWQNHESYHRSMAKAMQISLFIFVNKAKRKGKNRIGKIGYWHILTKLRYSWWFCDFNSILILSLSLVYSIFLLFYLSFHVILVSDNCLHSWCSSVAQTLTLNKLIWIKSEMKFCRSEIVLSSKLTQFEITTRTAPTFCSLQHCSK